MCRLLNWRLLLVVAAACFPGCRDPYELAPVTGRVLTCEGKPAVGGIVTFSPIEEPAVTGRPPGYPGTHSLGIIDEEGKFSLEPYSGNPRREGALTGRHQVMFIMPVTETPQPNMEDASAMTQVEFEEYLESLQQIELYPAIPCSTDIKPAEVYVPRQGAVFEFVLSPPNPSAPSATPESPAPVE